MVLFICQFGVINSEKLDIVLEEASEFSSKGGGKLRTMIRDEGVM